MHLVRRSAVLPLLVVAGIGIAGCGGGSGDDDADAEAIKKLPKVTQNDVLDAPDVATANARCALFQKKKPKQVTQMRFRVKGSPSVLCIIQ